MKLYICVGSSCHIKGSYKIIAKLKEFLKRDEVTLEELELCASFCLNRCADGVSMKMDEDFILGATEDNIEDIYFNKILTKIR